MTNSLIEKLEALPRYVLEHVGLNRGENFFVKYDDLRAIIEQAKAEQAAHREMFGGE